MEGKHKIKTKKKKSRNNLKNKTVSVLLKNTDNINFKLQTLHESKFNFDYYNYEPINNGLAGGQSGAILFNIFDKKTGKVNNNFIGKTLVSASLFRNSNRDYIFDKNINGSYIENYIEYIKKYKTSYIAKIHAIGNVKLNNNTYLSIIIENLSNYSKMKSSLLTPHSQLKYDSKFLTDVSFDFKILNKPFDNSNNNNLKSNLEILVEKLNIKLDTKIIKRDLDFLSKNNRIDYSSILFIKGNKYRYGIIDILQPYNTKKKIENVFKNIFEIRSSIIKPNAYKKEFFNLLKKFNLIS
jgi:hypothetical protein